MFKDFNKYLSTSLKVYLFVLLLLFILKLVGLDYFGIDSSNKTIKLIQIFLEKNKLIVVSYFIVLMIYQYLMCSIITKDNSKKLKIFTLYTIPFTALLQHIKSIYINSPVLFIAEMIYIILICKLYSKDVKIKESIKKLLIILLLQFISYITRGNVDSLYETSYISNLILNLDYFVMLLIYQKVEMKGGIKCQDIVGSSSLKKMNLKNLLKRLQISLHNFKQQDKKTKLTIIIYSIFSIIWNLLTLFVIFLIAKINGTITECIFITASFWITKKTFGKAFHLPNMLQCFIVSNATYYLLNRLTTPLGISILVPILLGVGLSYITSKLVRKIYKPLYRGMPEDLFNDTILKVVDKDSDKYKICYEYFVEKKSAVKLSMKYSYSEAGIRKIKDRVNKKIEELNK